MLEKTENVFSVNVISSGFARTMRK